MFNALQTQLIGTQGPISGTFRVMAPYLGENDFGRPYVRCRLEDASGYLYAFSWHDEVIHSQGLYNLSRVYVEGVLRPHDNQMVVELKALIPAQNNYADIIRLIPQHMCPFPTLLFELAGVLRLVTISSLRHFVGRIMTDDSISFPFVSCPGSLNHHHNYPGGLLKHSLEGVSIVEHQRSFSREDYELGLIAALFHDIGKILTLTPQMRLTSLGSSIEHDKLTSEVLGSALHQFHQDWPDGAKKLRYMLGWKAQRSIPHHTMADLVAYSDRISCGLENDRKKARRHKLNNKCEGSHDVKKILKTKGS